MESHSLLELAVDTLHVGLVYAGRLAENAMHSQSNSSVPPPGSLPINETPWSGDHGSIKKQVGASPADNVKIDPDGNVWVQNPDGSWTDYGPASDYTGSGKPDGKRGKDRKKEAVHNV